MPQVQQGGPARTMASPFLSIRYMTKSGLFHAFLIPLVLYKDALGNVIEKFFGYAGTALEQWQQFVTNGISHKGEELKECELLYGGHLMSDDTVVTGCQVLERWTPETGLAILNQFDDSNVLLPASSLTPHIGYVGGFFDQPQSAATQDHIPNPERPQTTVVLDGSPHIPKVEIPVQTSNATDITKVDEHDPAQVTVNVDEPTAPEAPTEPVVTGEETGVEGADEANAEEATEHAADASEAATEEVQSN